MFWKALELIFLGLALQWVYKTLVMLDVHKRVYNHRPGDCRRVKGIEYGSEDIEKIDGKGIAFVTSGLVYLPKDPNNIKYKGQIFLYDLKARNFEAKPLPILNLEDEDGFHPHGISHWILKDGTIRLFIVVHSKQFKHSIVLLDYDENKKQLKHVRTVRNPDFVRPNDVVATGENTFLVSNDGGAQTGLLNAVEVLSGFYRGSLLHFDGKESKMLISNTCANGISFSRDRKTLFVSHINDKIIGVYKWDQKNAQVTKVSKIHTMTGCDNFHIDENDKLWSGCHPNMKQGIAHLDDPFNLEVHAPSQVLRVSFSKDYKSADYVEVLVDEGKLISASSIAVSFDSGKQMLVGSVSRELVHCDITTPLDF